MAIKPTPNNNIFKSLIFDGVDSRDYGIYITGDAVFNSPERDVEMIEIPGRNGAYALDKGRFGNIEVSYPAGIFGDTEADFREGIRAFRNALASRKGYKRLEDDYNPTEYRMAVYKSGLEVTPTALKAGEFTITFDCQPQRFLKSGETAVTVADGGTITNPTLFESRPLVEVEGYGRLSVNGDNVVVHNEPYGLVTLLQPIQTTRGSEAFSNNVSLMNTGDSITVESGSGSAFEVWEQSSGSDYVEVTAVSASLSGDISGTATPGSTFFNIVAMDLDGFALTNGTTATKTFAVNTSITYKVNGAQRSASTVLTFAFKYDADAQTVSFYHVSTSPALPAELRVKLPSYWYYATITGNSTKLLVGDTIYLDLDIGEAYYYGDNGIASVNNIVEMPAELPTLKVGENVIEYSDTFDSVKVIPRWWEV